MSVPGTEVSVPYEITLLSNKAKDKTIAHEVSVPYEITLLANSTVKKLASYQFQYLMKLHYSQTT